MPTRVHIGRLDAITGGTDQFGLYVSGPDGTTIIDGTSDMFRIATTGTIATAGCNGTGGACTNSTEIHIPTGLEAAPVMLAFAGTSPTSLPLHSVADMGAPGGGGAVIDSLTIAALAVPAYLETWITLYYSSYDTDNSGSTATVRYYLLHQVAV